MKIDKSKTKLIFEFQADEWFICGSDEQKTCWPYSLNFRIDRSYKGKDDDIGMPKIFLDEEEAEQARKSGFSEVISTMGLAK